MATEQQLLDALEQSIANTDRSNSDLLLVMKEGNLSDVTLRDNTVVPSLSKRVKENTDVFKGEFEASVNLQTQAQLDLFNANATTAFNTFDTNTTSALDSFDGTATQALTNLQTAIDSINNEGNAASATKLQTARKINGIDFDGTQDINITSMSNMEAVEFNDSSTLRGVVNNLTTGGNDKALTASQGKFIKDSFNASLDVNGWQRNLSGQLEQWGLVPLTPVGDFGRQDIGGVTYYNHYYVITFPIAFPNACFVVRADISCSSDFSQQSTMGGIKATCSRDTSNAANNRSRFIVCITSPYLGFVPLVYWEAVGA